MKYKILLYGLVVSVAAVFAIVLVNNGKEVMDYDDLMIQDWKQTTQEIFETHYTKRDFLDKETRLKDVVPFEWDYVFREEGGYTDGGRIVQFYIKNGSVPFDLNGYKVSDEYFSDNEDGLIFVNIKKKILVTIPITVSLSGDKSNFLKSDSACLLGKLGPRKNYYFFLKECER